MNKNLNKIAIIKTKEEVKDLDDLKPIDHGVVAKTHTPVYKMHRFYARRPYSVFSELISHYSNSGSIVLDPFCGGGVTVVEALRLRRKVIGVDINPLASFITRMEVSNVDTDKLKQAFEEINDGFKQKIESMYIIGCPKCKEKTPAEWFEWSKSFECPHCQSEVIIYETRK